MSLCIKKKKSTNFTPKIQNYNIKLIYLKNFYNTIWYIEVGYFPTRYEFGHILRRLHYLTKAKRWLTEEEVKEIEELCQKIGHLYPRIFRPVSITPKLHDIIFYLPRMAKRFQTVGGCREDAIESRHAQVPWPADKNLFLYLLMFISFVLQKLKILFAG